MPEGPSLVILKEAVQHFKGKKIIHASGNAKIDFDRLAGKKILDMRTWGKHFIIVLDGLFVRVHLLMFGSFSVDEQTRADRSLRLHLEFSKGDLYFYTGAVKMEEGHPDDSYDWEADVMGDEWNPRKARKKLKLMPSVMVCDALLDQQVFSGVGNIIKNEVLYRVRAHPECEVGTLPPRKLTELIKEARIYSFDFLEWKKAFQLKKRWLVYTKKVCKRCDLPIFKKYCGTTKRRTFFCKNCQERFGK